MTRHTLREAFLRDLALVYDAEHHALEALRDLRPHVHAAGLTALLRAHKAGVTEQVAAVEGIFAALGQSPRRGADRAAAAIVAAGERERRVAGEERALAHWTIATMLVRLARAAAALYEGLAAAARALGHTAILPMLRTAWKRAEELARALVKDLPALAAAATPSAAVGAAPRRPRAPRRPATGRASERDGQDARAPMLPPVPVPVPASGTGTDLRVPVFEEALVAHKRRGTLGRVRVRKEVVRERETVMVPLRHEEVTVERVPMDQAVAPDAAPDAFQGMDIDVPVRGERAVVGTRARVVERGAAAQGGRARTRAGERDGAQGARAGGGGGRAGAGATGGRGRVSGRAPGTPRRPMLPSRSTGGR